MSKLEPLKLVPRNAPALRMSLTANPQPRLNAGNPVSTRLESGIGNCFPGLECDLRNLERRFFPFLEMDMPDVSIDLVMVDMDGAKAAKARGAIEKPAFDAYTALSQGKWTVETMEGDFGPLGHLVLSIPMRGATSSGAARRPVDPWTAARLLDEGSEVRLVLRRTDRGGAGTVAISGKRARYLGDDGALAAMFAPGELTQSLCSPWTHDFRDCACYYWASHHPDIAMPPLPSAPTNDPKWDRLVPWERTDRALDKLPAPATVNDPAIIDYFDINRDWQKLNFVIERREQTGPYAQRVFTGKPLRDDEELAVHLRYAAGVEIAVLQEYMTAAFSLKPERALRGRLRDDVRATFEEIMRIALGEMRHIRAVNFVLASLLGRPGYTPALNVASKIPGPKPGQKIPVKPSALTRDALDRFIAIEAPSESVDSVYARILATLNEGNSAPDIQAVRTIMAEGEDHYRTFLAMKEWLAPHAPQDYLRAPNAKRPPSTNVLHRTLQTRYRSMLVHLYRGYAEELPGGAEELNQARNAMIGASGIRAAADAVAQAGFLVVFDTLSEKRFAPIAPPP